ncbi:phage tail tape measure protein [Desulfovibrio cuneatus]|uniref:phage tail tape measure protein n=1 Tax=Desulfovibrio cuneatus TaxID=159728 RepID=UPI0004034473|nr:phage tail tape measure protein [Desulfovibrio cuneatus]
MATKLEKLEFLIGVKDAASSKLGKLQKTFSSMRKQAGGELRNLMGGAMAAWGGVTSLKQIMQPAIEMKRALGEVESLGVAADGLDELRKMSTSFAFDFGGAATDVVRSAYDIQSAIGGLTGKELASFTQAGGILAKGTKANVATITGYMGTMYGVFEKDANAMGKAAWVEQLAGRTAYAVKVFKTNGEQFSAAFTGLGADATAAGVSAAEQMAVLGQLQTTMGGGEAATKYKAFLRGVGNAQKELGLKLTDKSGNMLGIVDIMDKVRGKFGNSISVKEGDVLKKAFGSDEAVSMINLLLNKTDALKTNISDIGNIKGMDGARTMARSMTDVWQRWNAGVSVTTANFGSKMLPMLERFTTAGLEKLKVLNGWIEKYPRVARLVGMVLIGLAATAAVLGVITVLASVFSLILSPLGLIAFLVLAIPVGIILAITYWKELKGFFADTSWGQPILWVMEKFEERWNMLKDLFTDFKWTKLFKLAIAAALTPLEGLLRLLGEGLAYLGAGDMAAKLQSFSAMEIATNITGHTTPGQENTAPNGMAMPAVNAHKQVDIPKGGGVQQMLSTRTTSTGKQINIAHQEVFVTPEAGATNEDLMLTAGVAF